MGGDLPAPTAGAPSFAVWAVKDPTSANLDRIQIIKGRSSSGQSFEKIYDVAWSGGRRPDADTGRIPLTTALIRKEAERIANIPRGRQETAAVARRV